MSRGCLSLQQPLRRVSKDPHSFLGLMWAWAYWGFHSCWERERAEIAGKAPCRHQKLSLHQLLCTVFFIGYVSCLRLDQMLLVHSVISPDWSCCLMAFGWNCMCDVALLGTGDTGDVHSNSSQSNCSLTENPNSCWEATCFCNFTKAHIWQHSNFWQRSRSITQSTSLWAWMWCTHLKVAPLRIWAQTWNTGNNYINKYH